MSNKIRLITNESGDWEVLLRDVQEIERITEEILR